MDVTGLSVDSQLTRLYTQTAHRSFTWQQISDGRHGTLS